ncbi:MAG: AEC family transporter [Pseudomonadota bacterium]
MQILLDVTLPVFIVIGAGYLAVWRNLFSQSQVDGLMKFTQNFAIPCLLFRAISELDLGESFDWRLLLSFYTGSVSVFIAGALGARYIFGRPPEDSVAIGFCCLFANSVLLGLAISERAFGLDSMAPNYAIVAVHAPICYGIGITTMEIVRQRGAFGVATLGNVLKAMFRNALMIGIALGFATNLSGADLPEAITDAVDLMVRAALPAALFGLGGVLVQYRIDGDLKEVAYICLLSLLVHPLIVWGMGTQVIDITREQLRSAVITAAMAPGVNTYIFANMYGVAKRVSASGVLLGTLASVLSASVWLLLF